MRNMSLNDVFVNIISCGINDTPLDNDTKGYITEDIYEELYTLGEKHHVTHIIADVLLKEKIVEDDEFIMLLRANIMSAINKTEKIRSSLRTLCDLFETNNIPFIPLKGSVIRNFYHKDWYRSSSDIDVLVKKEDFSMAEKLLTESLNCKFCKRGPHDVSYISENGVNIELHFTLIVTDSQSIGKGYRRWNAEILESVWERAQVKDGYSYYSELSNGDFYMYHIAHMAKHFENGGCGIRSIIDLYLMNKAGMYGESAEKLLDESGLSDFAKAVMKLSEVWLSDDTHDEISHLTARFIIDGGIFGNPQNKVDFGSASKGRARYILSRIFMPYSLLKTVYPVLCKHKWLYPLYIVIRWFRCLSPDIQKRVVGELKSDAQDTDVPMLIKKLGL